jgi:hypothetical protein
VFNSTEQDQARPGSVFLFDPPIFPMGMGMQKRPVSQARPPNGFCNQSKDGHFIAR